MYRRPASSWSSEHVTLITGGVPADHLKKADALWLQKVKPETRVVSASTFVSETKVKNAISLHGHVGSLYLVEEGKPRQQLTRGEATFHNGLRDKFRENKTSIAQYKGALLKYVRKNCWDGNLSFLHEDLQAITSTIPNEFKGPAAALGKWGMTLQALADKAAEHRGTIEDLIRS